MAPLDLKHFKDHLSCCQLRSCLVCWAGYCALLRQGAHFQDGVVEERGRGP